jgi:hypothetical protein
MLFSLTTNAFFFVHAAFFAVSVDGKGSGTQLNRCYCADVCSAYQSGSGCWEMSFSCPTCYDLSVQKSCFSEKCIGGCSCDLFGCKCEACGTCSGRRELQSVVSNATNATNGTTDCTDYYYYMNLTLAEKVARFEELYCGPIGLTASDSIVRRIEALVKSNASEATISCQDFNSAYVTNMSEVYGFCTNITNLTYLKLTKPPATTPSGPTTKASSVMGTFTFQMFLATAFATGIASLLA